MKFHANGKDPLVVHMSIGRNVIQGERAQSILEPTKRIVIGGVIAPSRKLPRFCPKDGEDNSPQRLSALRGGAL